MNYCKKCKRSDECDYVWKNTENPVCVSFMPIVTNADKIRAMSDEELSIWLDDITGETGDVPWCVLPCVQADNPRGARYCEKCAENWLKQEAT